MRLRFKTTHEKLAGYLGAAILFPLVVSALDQNAGQDTDASYWTAYLFILIIVGGAYLYRQSLLKNRESDFME